MTGFHRSWPTLSSGSDSESSSDYGQMQKPKPATQKRRPVTHAKPRIGKKASSSSAGDFGRVSSDDDRDRKASRRSALKVR